MARKSPVVALEITCYNCVEDAQKLKQDLYAHLVEQLQPEYSGDIDILVTEAVGDKADVPDEDKLKLSLRERLALALGIETRVTRRIFGSKP